MIEDAIYERLSGDTAVAAMASNRIYPLFAPERAARPFLVYRTVSETRDMPLAGPNGFVAARIQVDAVGASYDSARDLSDYARQALDGFRGTAGGHFVQRVRLDNRRDGYEFETEGSEQPVVIVSMDLMVVYGEQ